MVQSDDGRQVPVVQAYAFGKYLGYLNVSFDEKGNVIHTSGNPILLNSSIAEGMVNGCVAMGVILNMCARFLKYLSKTQYSSQKYHFFFFTLSFGKLCDMASLTYLTI